MGFSAENFMTDIVNNANKYASKVFCIFNAYGNATEKAEVFLAESRKLNIAYFALTALFLAFRWEQEGCNPRDGRDYMSKKYAYENRDRFLNIFEKYGGFRPVFSIDIPYTSWENANQFKNTAFEGWNQVLVTEHPTIRQSYMRGFVGALHEELGLPDGTFPLI